MSLQHNTMEKAQVNQSWYDTHMRMQRKSQESGLRATAPIPNDIDNEQDTSEMTSMMNVFDASDLQIRILVVQQQLYAYHSLLDEMEELRAENKQLENHAADLLKECSRHKKKLKREKSKAVQSLEEEIVALKLELVQSRGKEDLHNFQMQTMLDEKKTLEEEVKFLQQRKYEDETICTQSTNNRIQTNMMGVFQLVNKGLSVHPLQAMSCKHKISEKALEQSVLVSCRELDTFSNISSKENTFSAVSA